MKNLLSRLLRGPADRLAEFAAAQRCRTLISDLVVDPAMPFKAKLDRVDDWLQTLYRRGVFNGTVLIAEHGEIRFERHYGYADLLRTIPLTSHSSFSLASLSKQFTAMGMMLLAHKGRLALDDAVAAYLPELAGYGGVTIRHLLLHTSGLPDYMALAERYGDGKAVITARDVVALLERHRPPFEFEPGEEFEYSNTGYALLEAILTRVSGASYPDFMQAEIFGPLGMDDSAAFNLASKECTLRSRVFGLRGSYAGFGRKVLCDLNYMDGVYGDGGIYASARDLARWDAALRNGALIPVAIYQQAYLSGRLNNGAATGYGFGWGIESSGVVAHWGNWQGFTTYIRRDLNTNSLLVVLSNLAPMACVDAIAEELRGFVEDLG
jgi:CubicO group peptidase (beta-lactamase class C family)